MSVEGVRPKEFAYFSEKQWQALVKEEEKFFGEELDRDMKNFPQERRSLIRTIGAGTLALALTVGLGNKYVDIYRDDITAMRENRYAESGFVPKPELTVCQRVSRDSAFAVPGRIVANWMGMCQAEIAAAKIGPKIIVSFNNSGAAK